MDIQKRINKFHFNKQIQQPSLNIELPQANKPKFFKDLNSRTNHSLRDNEIITKKNIVHSKQELNGVLRRRNRQASQIKLQRLLLNLVPGSKFVKGQIKQNKLHGKIQIQYYNGNIFQGVYRNGVRIEGKSVYQNAGCFYQGAYCGQLFSGYGKLTYIKGRAIEGQWDNHLLIGKALITYPNNDCFYGSVNDKLFRHGKGYLFLKNGDKYIGQFNNGSITGIGAYYKNDSSIIKGVWLRGQLIKQVDFNQYSYQLDIDPMIFQGMRINFCQKTKQKGNRQNQNQMISKVVQKTPFPTVRYKMGMKLKTKEKKDFINEQPITPQTIQQLIRKVSLK